jgi:hypothetical protein
VKGATAGQLHSWPIGWRLNAERAAPKIMSSQGVHIARGTVEPHTACVAFIQKQPAASAMQAVLFMFVRQGVATGVSGAQKLFHVHWDMA